MSDNPKKKKLDGKRISQQPWEQAYKRRKNAKKESQTVGIRDVPRKDAGIHANKHQLSGLFFERMGRTGERNRKLELALLKMENALLKNPIHDKGPIEFCKEWEEKGKPIFNMVLVLFTFSAKVKATIRRIMNGIDGVCKVPEPVE